MSSVPELVPGVESVPGAESVPELAAESVSELESVLW